MELKRSTALLAAVILLAGCGATPPKPLAGLGAEVTSSAQPIPAEQSGGASQQEPAEQSGGASQEVPPEQSGGSAQPAPSTQPSTADLLAQMERVPAPEVSELSPDTRAQLSQTSPWEAAQKAILWHHGLAVQGPLFMAPALEEQVGPTGSQAPDQVWTTHVSSWEDSGRFYFHVQVTGRQSDGRLYRAGIDVVEVSTVEGGGPVVTGYAHAPWAAEPAEDPVAVWIGRSPDAYLPPAAVRLPAPAIPTGQAGEYLVPVEALTVLGAIWQDGQQVVVELKGGLHTEAMTSVIDNGVSYVAIDDVVRAIDGKRSSSSVEGSHSYQVEWNPDLRQLCLWYDTQHPIS